MLSRHLYRIGEYLLRQIKLDMKALQLSDFTLPPVFDCVIWHLHEANYNINKWAVQQCFNWKTTQTITMYNSYPATSIWNYIISAKIRLQ